MHPPQALQAPPLGKVSSSSHLAGAGPEASRSWICHTQDDIQEWQSAEGRKSTIQELTRKAAAGHGQEEVLKLCTYQPWQLVLPATCDGPKIMKHTPGCDHQSHLDRCCCCGKKKAGATAAVCCSMIFGPQQVTSLSGSKSKHTWYVPYLEMNALSGKLNSCLLSLAQAPQIDR